MAYDTNQYFDLNMNEINEKDVDFLHVFISNITLIFKNFGLGLITFGFYTIFSLVQNVISLGIIANSLVINNYSELFYKMIPHGVIEMFGIVLSVCAVLYCLFKIARSIPKIIKQQVNISTVLLDNLKFVLLTLSLEIAIFLSAGIIEVIVSRIKVI